MVPVRDDNLIGCSKTWGPTFGDGNDIWITDRCNLSNKSTAYFPYTYNTEGIKKYVKGKDSFQMFSGSENGQFKVKEY